MNYDFPLHTTDSAPEASRGLLVQVQKKYGMTPNIFRVMASSPALLQSYLAVGQAFAASSLTHIEQHIVLMSVSATNGCAYCVGAHSAVGDMSGIPTDVTNALRDGTAIPDAKLEVLRRFTQYMVERRGWVDAEAQANFYAAGYSQQAMLDVITGVGMKTLSNYMNHITTTPLDEAFAVRRWQKSK